MGEMRDSDWSRQILLRSDWLLPIGAIMTTNLDSIGRSNFTNSQFILGCEAQLGE